MEEELFGFQIVSGLHGVLGQAICGVQVNGRNLTQLEQMEMVAVIKGTEVSFGTSRKENIANVAAYFDSLGNRVERSGFGTVA